MVKQMQAQGREQDLPHTNFPHKKYTSFLAEYILFSVVLALFGGMTVLLVTRDVFLSVASFGGAFVAVFAVVQVLLITTKSKSGKTPTI